ncbi:hypothetical protein LCGC14_0446690 [marine sediment metagenome]|uniref:Uncharacterized protein n=1 Tax=marine sediment metagenome TaxID=412755 RepID=A0A0F9VT24_9ZZZZ
MPNALMALLDNMLHTPNHITHMTRKDKTRELHLWHGKIKGPRGPGGMGYPDDRIIPLCAAINDLKGICTLQSCAGHQRSDEQHWSAPANLWLWFGQHKFNMFVQHATRLVEDAAIDRIDLLYGRYNDRRVIASITFSGDDQNTVTLDCAAKIIYHFLEHLPEGW